MFGRYIVMPFSLFNAKSFNGKATVDLLYSRTCQWPVQYYRHNTLKATLDAQANYLAILANECMLMLSSLICHSSFAAEVISRDDVREN